MRPISVIDLVSSHKEPKFEPAGQMAAKIIEITHARGGCLPQDLNAHGFSPDEVVQHWHLAQSIATVEMKLMKEKGKKPKEFLGAKD